MSNNWSYRTPEKIEKGTLHIEVIADYGGNHNSDHAFDEVRNHFLRFDKYRKIRGITEHPVYAFSTLETGFWIAQMGLHSEHRDLVIFSNTAPRGDIIWHGEERQNFVCGILDNGIPFFAVNAGYNLSFIKGRIKGIWEVKVPNVGTQFRSRDYYPEATVAILYGNMNRIGPEIDQKSIPDVPDFVVASVDGYGNLKTTIRRSQLSETMIKSPVLRVGVNGKSFFVLNTLAGANGVTGDLCLVSGSSGGKKGPYLEIIKMHADAAKEYHIDGPRDNLGKIKIEAVKSK